jgi:hypothetical protein
MSAWVPGALDSEADGQQELDTDQREVLCWGKESSGHVERDCRDKRGKHSPDNPDDDSGEIVDVLSRYLCPRTDAARRSEINGNVRPGPRVAGLDVPGAQHADHV